MARFPKTRSRLRLVDWKRSRFTCQPSQFSGLPPTFAISGDLLNKDCLARYLIALINQRGLLDKGNGFFNDIRFDGNAMSFVEPHCIYSVILAKPSSSSGAGGLGAAPATGSKRGEADDSDAGDVGDASAALAAIGDKSVAPPAELEPDVELDPQASP